MVRLSHRSCKDRYPCTCTCFTSLCWPTLSPPTPQINPNDGSLSFIDASGHVYDEESVPDFPPGGVSSPPASISLLATRKMWVAFVVPPDPPPPHPILPPAMLASLHRYPPFMWTRHNLSRRFLHLVPVRLMPCLPFHRPPLLLSLPPRSAWLPWGS